MTVLTMRIGGHDLEELRGVVLIAIGSVIMAAIGPAVVLDAVVVSDPTWSVSNRLLVGGLGVFLTVFLGFPVVCVIRAGFRLPRATVTPAGLRLGDTTTEWDRIGAVRITRLAGVRALAIGVPPGALATIASIDRFAISLNPTENGMTIVYVTGRDLGIPLEDALAIVPPEHRRS